MLMTISRESDQFMAEGPNKNWCPHRLASWRVDVNNWVVDINDVGQLLTLGEKISLSRGGIVPHVEINDVKTS